MSDETNEQDAQEPVAYVKRPVKYKIPPGTTTRYVTNMIAQPFREEILVTFFEVFPPPIIGSEEEKQEILEDLKEIQAECLGRFVFSPDRIPSVIRALSESLENHKKIKGTAVPQEGVED